MFEGIKKFFKERAEENARREGYRLEAAEKQYEIDIVRVNGRVNLRKRIETELSAKNCPMEEIVPRFQSVIDDKHFDKFIQSNNYPKREKIYFELNDVFEKEGLDVTLYRNDSMATLFIEAATANAQRVLPEDAVDFAKTLFERKDYGTFSKLDWDWHSHDEKRLPKYFLTYGLVSLAAKVPQEDKIVFFDACESNVIIKTMAEFGNPVDFAALMYNIFGGIKLGDVEKVLFESGVMGLVPNFSDPEKLREAFDTLGRDMDPMLVHTLKKYIGQKPNEGSPSFEDNYPSQG